MSTEYTPEAIQKRWTDGYQIRDAGGWVRVRGQADPRHDVRALLHENERLRSRVAELEGGAKKKRSTKRRAIAVSTEPAGGDASVDSRTPTEE